MIKSNSNICSILIAIVFIIWHTSWSNGPIIETAHAWFLKCHLYNFVLVVPSNVVYFIINIGVLPQRLNVKKWKNIVIGLWAILFFFSINKFLYMRYYHVNSVVVRSWNVIGFKTILLRLFLRNLFILLFLIGWLVTSNQF